MFATRTTHIIIVVRDRQMSRWVDYSLLLEDIYLMWFRQSPGFLVNWYFSRVQTPERKVWLCFYKPSEDDRIFVCVKVIELFSRSCVILKSSDSF